MCFRVVVVVVPVNKIWTLAIQTMQNCEHFQCVRTYCAYNGPHGACYLLWSAPPPSFLPLIWLAERTDPKSEWQFINLLIRWFVHWQKLICFYRSDVKAVNTITLWWKTQNFILHFAGAQLSQANFVQAFQLKFAWNEFVLLRWIHLGHECLVGAHQKFMWFGWRAVSALYFFI